ncbi:MAG: NUDIX hydrolase [Oculatellaceae cyanobacterium bins.114]|nr:NUDIX hydrolase [Oculatellaceae cyanobacterium bins.114]
MQTHPIEVAIAILHQDNQFLMQLRDNIPGIIYPGHWGFFGGHLDPGESPEEAMWRELAEEIEYTPPHLAKFKTYDADPQVIRHVYVAPLAVAVDTLQLHEGWDLGLLSVEDIQRGDRYSVKANQVRPLGKPHQQILLDFITQSL